MTALPRTKSDLDFVFDNFMSRGLDIPDSSSGCGAATNAYVVARKTGKIPFWCVRGTMAYSAARAGIKHHKKGQA